MGCTRANSPIINICHNIVNNTLNNLNKFSFFMSSLFLVFALTFFNTLKTIIHKNIHNFYNCNNFQELTLLMWKFFLLKDKPFAYLLFWELHLYFSWTKLSSKFNSNWFQLFIKSFSIAKVAGGWDALLLVPFNLNIVAYILSEFGRVLNIPTIYIFSKSSYPIDVKCLANTYIILQWSITFSLIFILQLLFMCNRICKFTLKITSYIFYGLFKISWRFHKYFINLEHLNHIMFY